MRDHAWIDYEIEGRNFRYKGNWPDGVDREIGRVWDKAVGEDHSSYGDFVVALMRHAGATILEIHSIRPDGTIRAEDLPDLKIP